MIIPHDNELNPLLLCGYLERELNLVSVCLLPMQSEQRNYNFLELLIGSISRDRIKRTIGMFEEAAFIPLGDLRALCNKDSYKEMEVVEIREVLNFALEHPKMKFAEIMDKYRKSP